MLQQLMNTGGMGTAGSPQVGAGGAGGGGDIMTVLADILAGGKGNAGGNIATLLGKQQERDVNGLRARFGAGGGASFGTPAAFAESQYRAEAAPQITQAITGMQLQAILPLLQQIGGLSQMGIPQAQMVQQKTGLGQALDVVGGLAQTGMQFAGGFRRGGLPPAPTMDFTDALNGISPVDVGSF